MEVSHWIAVIVGMLGIWALGDAAITRFTAYFGPQKSPAYSKDATRVDVADYWPEVPGNVRAQDAARRDHSASVAFDLAWRKAAANRLNGKAAYAALCDMAKRKASYQNGRGSHAEDEAHWCKLVTSAARPFAVASSTNSSFGSRSPGRHIKWLSVGSVMAMTAAEAPVGLRMAGRHHDIGIQHTPYAMLLSHRT